MIPEFTISPTFIDGIPATCLAATISNSRIPGVAERWIEEKGTDPQSEVYVRPLKSQEMSDRSREMLVRLLEQGELSSIIEQCLKDYERITDFSSDEFEDDEDRSRMKGVRRSCCAIVSMIVLDELENEIIIALETEVDTHLDEHGFVIYWKDGRWQFGYRDYLSDYIGKVRAQQRVAAMRASDTSESPTVEEGVTSMLGTWVFDEQGAEQIFKELRFAKRDREEALRFFRRIHLTISGAEWRLETGRSCGVVNRRIYTVVANERQGDRIVFTLKEKPPGIFSAIMFYKNGLLFDLDGRVFSRVVRPAVSRQT